MNKKAQGKFKVLFVAGFGPIVQDIPKSRKFYVDALDLSFQKEEGDYLHTEKLEGVKTFALCRFRRQHSPVLGRRTGRLTSRFLKQGWSSTLTTLSKPAQN